MRSRYVTSRDGKRLHACVEEGIGIGGCVGVGWLRDGGGFFFCFSFSFCCLMNALGRYCAGELRIAAAAGRG